ncbi:MAG TPA: DNA polymerase III subunit delta [Candidatus Krumholzibacteria bacterium]|nr:DNA polymerase III subunit delta [Candidatus Krumholzibacteria bacterium]HPD71532.1 DNA polymerase III subunit delta [Candidatus Krumholzibacteria bacterium]HRY41535.1 DNA polymerase III subunit delta [Candidatus Krumholzibacteria bacterium]
MARASESGPGFKTLRQQDLVKGKFRPVYVIAGEDQLRIQQTVEAIRDRVLDPAGVAFNFHLLDADQSGWSEALSQAQAFPMFAQRQIVWLRHADQARKDDPAEKALAAYFEKPAETTVLIITGEKFDGRRGWVQAAKASGYYFHFGAPAREELDDWLTRAAAQAKLTLDLESLRLLALLVGPDLQGLQAEIAKLALLQSSRGRAITAAELPELVMDQAQLEVWALTDAIDPGNVSAVLRTWFRLSGWGSDAEQLAPLVVTHLRRAALVSLLLADGVPAPAIAKQTELNPWQLRAKLAPLASRLDPRACRGILAACLECEIALKRRPLPPGIAFEQLLYRASRNQSPEWTS